MPPEDLITKQTMKNKQSAIKMFYWFSDQFLWLKMPKSSSHPLTSSGGISEGSSGLNLSK